MSSVYISLSLDMVHHGHMNLLENAGGDIIGLQSIKLLQIIKGYQF